MEADGLMSDAFIEGLAQGSHTSISQLRAIFESMHDQITRLEVLPCCCCYWSF
jgi:hypothetical protein